MGYEENNLEGENQEVDVTEVTMNEAEIDEFISALHELKENKEKMQFDISDDHELHISYEEMDDEDEEGEDDGEPESPAEEMQ